MQVNHGVTADEKAAIAVPIVIETDDPEEQRRLRYVFDLRSHDWDYEHSDDHGAWKRGQDSLRALMAERREIDADGAIWNEHCPAAHRVGVVS